MRRRVRHALRAAGREHAVRGETHRPRTRPRRRMDAAPPALAFLSAVPVRRRASALVAVLWSLSILCVIAVGMAHTASLELRIARNAGDGEKAYFLAIAGIEKAKALLYQASRGKGPLSTTTGWGQYDSPSEFRDVPLGSGYFRVVRRPRPGETARGVTYYGIDDEESRLDVNHASAGELARLPGMDAALAAAIADWRDEDSELTPQGAEREHYQGLRPPYMPRNGRIETVRELLMVRGMTARLLLGEDADGDGALDFEEDDGDRTSPNDNADGVLDSGLAAYMALESSVPNTNRRGEDRLDITQATAEELATLDGVSSDLAARIVAFRERNSFDSIADLLDVTSTGGEGAPQRGGPEVVDPSREVLVESAGDDPPDGGPRQGGERLIGLDLLKRIADAITASREPTLAGAVNINTAPFEVLACLEGAGEDLARAIVAHREGIGAYSSIAELLDVPGMTREIFEKLSARVTVRGGTFRVVSEGIVRSSGARRRIEAVVRLGDFEVETRYFREGS